MTAQDIISLQVGPTLWMSSLTYPHETSGILRVSPDQKDLNRVIIWKYHKFSTLEE